MLAKTKLNSIKVSVSKALMDWNISLDGFVSINNVLEEYDDMKKKTILKLHQLIKTFNIIIINVIVLFEE